MKNLSLLVAGLWVAGLAQADRPNIVYMMADDLGIGDVKCYGGDRCQTNTPALDSLARDGMLFSDAHATASVCVPSRMGIMTGRYAWRFKAPEENGPWGFLNPRLKTDAFTLGRMLQDAGYHTGYIGKWHLRTLMQTKNAKNQGPDNVDYDRPLKIGPNDYGFKYSFILPGSLDMFPYAFARNHYFQGNVTAQKGWSAFNRVGPAEENFEDYKVLDTFASEAEAFLERNAKQAVDGKPFFLYFALTAPHTPTSPSPRFRGRSRLGLYGDFVEETDDTMGRVLRALDRHGLRENTLVVATSDHGAAAYAGNIPKATAGQIHDLEKAGHYSGGIYRGFKFTVYEGGLRIPMLVRWPAEVKAGSRSDALVGLNDLVATVADIVEIELDPAVVPDPISYYPVLKNPKAESPRKTLVMQSPLAFVIRHENWKLAFTPSSGARGVWGTMPDPEKAWGGALSAFGKKPTNADLRRAPFVQLFDLDADIHEDENVAARRPYMVDQLNGLFEGEIAKAKNDLADIGVHRNARQWIK